ncbi:MAG: FHIPEP family type III secretion protein [Candidatus Xenobia bacterium]
MPKRTIYVRDEDEAIFDKLAEQGSLSAVIARAVKGEQVEFTVEKPDGPARGNTTLAGLMQMDPLVLELGRDLVPLVDPQQGAPLLEKVTAVRRRLALDLGFVMCGVRFRDDKDLPPNEYVIRVRNREAGRFELQPGRFLAVGSKVSRLKGKRTTVPWTGHTGVWLEQGEDAEGVTVLDTASAAIAHLEFLAREHIVALLGLQEVDLLLAPLRKTHPALVSAAIPEVVTMVQLWQLLRALLHEHVSIRDLVQILETILLGPRPYSHQKALDLCRAALTR